MRVLVTGATGFIGSHLCAALVARGDEVTALVRTPSKAETLPRGVKILKGDLKIFAEPDRVLDEVDVVVHLAGVVAAPTEDLYEAINFTAVQDLVECLERQEWKPKRLVFASSLAAAGPSPSDRPWTEADPLKPIEPYGLAKARAETVVARTTFPATSFRPCVVLGPDDPATLTLFKSARKGVGLRVGKTAQRLSFVDVRDVVSGIVAMCLDDRSGHFTYYISHPTAIDVNELWAGLSRAVDNKVRVIPMPSALLRAFVPVATWGSTLLGVTNQLDMKQFKQMTAEAFVCSSAALSADLGWTAMHGLDDALSHASEGYRRSGSLT